MTDLSDAKKLAEYRMTNKVRFVTAASLFDGHDAVSYTHLTLPTKRIV